MKVCILIFLIFIYVVHSYPKSFVQSRFFNTIKIQKEVIVKNDIGIRKSSMILQTTTYEAQIPIPQSIVSLGILIMFALVQYRITRSNNITNEKGIKLKQLEALKVKQLSEPNENIMGNIRSITQEIIELDDEALRLRTLIDIPGGPSFRLRVALLD